jgi:hypothetical protein
MFLFSQLGIKPRASHMLGKASYNLSPVPSFEVRKFSCRFSHLVVLLLKIVLAFLGSLEILSEFKNDFFSHF